MNKYKKLSHYTAFLPFVKAVNRVGWALEYPDMTCENGVTARVLRDNYPKDQTIALVLADNTKLYAIV